MPTVGAARSWALQELKRASVDSPALTADVLIGHVLGWDRVRLISHAEEEMGEECFDRLQGLIRRRAEGEPLQYLTGKKEFFGLEFRVTPAVLIPRPETEILVEKAIELLQKHTSPRPRFADVGTGSGCIAVSVAYHIVSSEGWAIDISAEALSVAMDNAERHGVRERIHFLQSDLFECFARRPSFDFILCNPPYVALEEYDSLPPEVRRHEPRPALLGGSSGMDVFRRLVPEALPRLAPGGFMLLETGAGQAEKVAGLMEREGLCVQEVLNDLQGIPRCVVGQKVTKET